MNIFFIFSLNVRSFFNLNMKNLEVDSLQTQTQDINAIVAAIPETY
jgi:hypothetical protein